MNSGGSLDDGKGRVESAGVLMANDVVEACGKSSGTRADGGFRVGTVHYVRRCGGILSTHGKLRQQDLYDFLTDPAMDAKRL